MNKTLEFELVSPEEKLVAEPVAHAVLPGVEGEIGIGPDHAPLVIALKPGVVRLYMNGLKDDPRRIFIAGGFADITGDLCTVLAERAVNLADLREDELRQERSNLMDEINFAKREPLERQRIQKRLDLVNAKLDALSARY